MRKLLTILVLTLCGTASVKSQTPEWDWSLLPDSTVKGVHYNHVAHMEGARRTYKGLYTTFRDELLIADEQLRLCRELNQNYKQEMSNNERLMKALGAANEALERDNKKLLRKADKLKPWATVGRVGTISVGLGAVGVGVAAGIKAIHDR